MCVKLVGRELWATAGFVQMVLPDPNKYRLSKLRRILKEENTKLKFPCDFD